MSKSSVARQRIAQINGMGNDVLAEAFTKQHYIAIAKIIAKHKGQKDAREIANDLADLFASDNSAFRREQFLSACGL
jgi:capsular polysaccharide biosynthesis protein